MTTAQLALWDEIHKISMDMEVQSNKLRDPKCSDDKRAVATAFSKNTSVLAELLNMVNKMAKIEDDRRMLGMR